MGRASTANYFTAARVQALKYIADSLMKRLHVLVQLFRGIKNLKTRQLLIALLAAPACIIRTRKGREQCVCDVCVLF